MKKFLSLTILSLVSFFIVGCAESAIDNNDKESDVYEEFTLTNFTSTGDEVEQTFSSVPQSVIVKGQASLDIMAALGLGDLIVGSASADNLPLKDEWNLSLDDVNHVDVRFSKEEAMGLNPDLIISNTRATFYDTRLDEVSFWHERDVNTFIMSSQVTYPLTIDKEYDDILNIGKIFDKEAEAKAIVDEMVEELSNNSAELPESNLDILFYEDWDNGYYRHYGTRTLAESFTMEINNRYRVLGENMKGGNSAEDMLAKGDPDIIVIINDGYDGISDEDFVKKTLENPQFQSWSAVANENVFVIKQEYLYAPGVRTIDSIKLLSEIFSQYEVAEV